VAYVERWWFQKVFAGREVDFPWTEQDPDAEMRIEPDDTTEAILALYRAETAKAREIVKVSSLEDQAKVADKEISLRWVILHMIEETARHNGHADFLRENIDGVIGE
jgi:hypothetical protein